MDSGIVDRNRHFPLLLMLALAIVGGALVIYATRWGAFLSDDSFWYIRPAEQALQGQGFHPTRSFAPGLSFVLILLGRLGLPPLIAVRWLNAGLFGVNLFLAGWIVWRGGGGKAGALLAGLLVLLSDILLESHGWAMSEALCLTFFLLAVVSFQEYTRRKGWGWLAGIVLAAGLACLTRLAGVTIVVAIALGLLLYSPVKPLGCRLGQATALGIASLLPMAAWMMRNQIVTGQALHYSGFRWAWPTLDTARWFIYNTLSWFIPGRLLRGRELLAGLAALALLVILLAVGLWWLRRSKRSLASAVEPALFVLLVNGLLIVGMLVVANGFSDLVAFNARYLIALLLALLMAVASAAGRSLTQPPLSRRIIVLALMGVFLLYYGYRSVDAVRALHADGLGYASRFTAASETVHYVQNHPGLKVITTGPEGMYFWLGTFYDGIYSYGSTTDDLIHKVCEEQATLILLRSMPAEMYGLDESRLTQQLSLLHSFNDSDLYICRP